MEAYPMRLWGMCSGATLWCSVQFSSVQFSHSVMFNYLGPHGLQHARLPCHHKLPEITQTHVHQDSDAIQPSHPLLPPSPPAFNLSQHQDLFQGVSSLQQVAKVLEFQLHHQFFQWIFRMNFLEDWLVGSPCKSKGISRVFSNTTVQKIQFFCTQLSL